MKKLLLLGGSRYLLPVIETAHKLDTYVITCDYLPNNTAHKFSDEYHNVSIIDKEKVLELAEKLSINGIMSFACDPGVVTAAYVAEKMNLPFQGSYRSVCIMQNKELFRNFLAENHFNVPKAKGYKDKLSALHDMKFSDYPVIVKPVDSAGSKGVSEVNCFNELSDAIDKAINSSLCRSFIIEEFLKFEGYHLTSDYFSVNGILKFSTFADHMFDNYSENSFIPVFSIWESSMNKIYLKRIENEIQRLIKMLKLKTGLYNIESCIANNGKPYIMEISPRGGGCGISEIQKMATGVDLIENEIRNALGMDLTGIREPIYDGTWCEIVIHSNSKKTGTFKELWIEPQVLKKYIKKIDLQVKKGDLVEPFTGANKSLGDIFLRTENRKEMDRLIERKDEWLKIIME